jgi:hypothetical protein
VITKFTMILKRFSFVFKINKSCIPESSTSILNLFPPKTDFFYYNEKRNILTTKKYLLSYLIRTMPFTLRQHESG